jgi:glycosyltransferase involved in cell wall biosynthesis
VQHGRREAVLGSGDDANGRRIRIAYVIKSMVVGGSQTHLTHVLRLLDRTRFEPTLYCLTGEGTLLDGVRALGVPVVTPAADRSFKGAALALRVAVLARALRGAHVAIVHNYLLRANLVGAVSARLARVPLVLGSKRGCHERRGLELLSAKVGNRLADCVTVNAEAVRDFVHDNEGCPREKMVVIPSGVDTDRFRPLPIAPFKARLGLNEACTVVGVVTRMRVRKGVEEFIRAIGRLRQTHPNAHGVIVGEVSLDASLQALVRSLGLESHLSLLGRRSDMPEVLSAFDVFVLSSHDEGMSNAILEAMAMEKPVVATDVGGTGEVVRHGQSGLLVPPKDPESLAAAIGDILSQPTRACEMGRLGRRIVEEGFSAHSMVRQMERLYSDLLAERGVAVARAVETSV